MVIVTKAARELLDSVNKQALRQVPPGPQGSPTPALRLVIQDGQAGLALDMPKAGDEMVEHDGHPILLVDPAVGQRLDGMTLGTRETDDGIELTLQSDTAAGIDRRRQGPSQ